MHNYQKLSVVNNDRYKVKKPITIKRIIDTIIIVHFSR